MPEEKLTPEELDEGRRLFAAGKAADYMIIHLKTDNTMVLHEAHRMYVEAQVACFDYWDRLLKNHPRASVSGVAIEWHRSVIKWTEPEKENKNE